VANKDDKPVENIFTITDGIVRNMNRTKKMFLIMIASVAIVVPGTFVVTFALLGADSFWSGVPPESGQSNEFAFGIARTIVIVFLLSWIAIGIRQWFVLSKWTQRYDKYKGMQKKIDEKLDYEIDENNKEKGKDSENLGN
jgi:hypothetical protein